MMKKLMYALSALVLCLPAVSGGCRAETDPEPLRVTVSEFKGFGSVDIGITAEQFGAAGFEPGDSCDIVFSTGYRLDDVPYYTGYNARTGEPEICAYPGYQYPTICFCNGESMWKAAGLSEGDTAEITLREKGKYGNIERQLKLVYSLDRSDYSDDETFANYRPLTGGKIALNRFYRGASPVDDRMHRADTADSLIRRDQIRFVLDLADTEEDVEGFRREEGFSSRWFAGLYREKQVQLLGLNDNCRGSSFRESLARGLRAMLSSGGPVYIHCLEGKDRTGFVCLLLEALAGADCDELRRDYMLTYRAYYGITEESDPERYGTIVSVKFADMLAQMTGLPDGADYGGNTLYECARGYLRDCGMTEQEIDGLVRRLTEE